MNKELTVVIATFNSATILPRVLKALSSQSYSKKKMELIFVDGGSTDNTIRLGKKFGAKIIKNPRTEPVFGKFLGYIRAKGKYLMYLDHDEVLLNKKSIVNKINALKESPNAACIAGGNYVSPKGYPFINDYINEFGDPFSFFIYRLSKSSKFFIKTLKVRYPVKERKDYVLVDFSNVRDLPIIEQAAGGSVIDARVLKKIHPNTKTDFTLLPHYFYLLKTNYPELIVMKNDEILHYSSDTLGKYLKKIIWRVKNNIFFASMGRSGFVGRQEFNRYSSLKKYLFIPYSLSIVFPLADSLLLSATRKDIRYIIHLFLVFFISLAIIYFYIKKFFGVVPSLKSYDESKVVKLK